jgi:hypothetical protein
VKFCVRSTRGLLAYFINLNYMTLAALHVACPPVLLEDTQALVYSCLVERVRYHREHSSELVSHFT